MGKRLAAAAVAVAVMAGAAGCGGSGNSGQVRARQVRAQTVAQMQALARRFLASGLGPVIGNRGPHGTEGNYRGCPPARAHGMANGIYYSTNFAAGRVSEATGRGSGFRQRVASVLTGAGWRLAPVSTPRDIEPFGYDMIKGHLDGFAEASLRTGRIFVVLISLNSQCFDAGSAKASLTNKAETDPLPSASG
jgi:hypothetical protein